MKSKSFFLVLLLFVANNFFASGSKQEDPLMIPIQPGVSEQDPNIGRPRVPAFFPFSAYIDSDAGELILCANSGCGIIRFSVVNTLSGDTYSSQSTALSQGDFFSYSIPWQSGLWEFTFTLNNGSSYYGQIIL